MAELRIHFDVRLSPAVQGGLAACLLLLIGAQELGSEQVNLTTYYPSPGGIYATLRAGTAYLATGAGMRVGVGTTAPQATFDVAQNRGISDDLYTLGGTPDVVLASGGSLFFDGNYSYATGNYIRPVGGANTQYYYTAGVERLRLTNSKLVCQFDNGYFCGLNLGPNNVFRVEGMMVARASGCTVAAPLAACPAGQYATTIAGFRSLTTIAAAVSPNPPYRSTQLICCPCGVSGCP